MSSYTAAVELTEILDASQDYEVPAGFQRVQIYALGAGGATNGGLLPGGGGAGAIAYREYTVLEGDVGTTLTIVVGQGVSNADGGDTTVNGALNGATIATLSAGGGKKASVVGIGGAGGIAAGGTTNTDGAGGADFDNENDIPGAAGTNSGSTVEDYVSLLFYTRGAAGEFSETTAGGPGLVILVWSN